MSWQMHLQVLQLLSNLSLAGLPFFPLLPELQNVFLQDFLQADLLGFSHAAQRRGCCSFPSGDGRPVFRKREGEGMVGEREGVSV